jgi:hypothetical protein
MDKIRFPSPLPICFVCGKPILPGIRFRLLNLDNKTVPVHYDCYLRFMNEQEEASR